MATGAIESLNLGKFLQIAFSEGIRNQISEDYRDWEMIKQCRVGNPEGRSLYFLFQSSYGPAATQYRNPAFTAAFPTGQQLTSNEYTAVYKELSTTIEVEYNVWNRAQKSPNTRYLEPIAAEIAAKTTSAKRRLAADLYGDGTGVVGESAGAADDTDVATGTVVITQATANTSAGHIGFFEFGDLILAKNRDGTAVSPTGAATFYAYRILSKNRQNNTVTLQLVNSSGAVIAGASASNIAADDFFYRVGQPTFPDRDAPGDYGSTTEVIPGLESLASSDGRLVHGITMSGANAASLLDASAAALDVSHLQRVMDQAKINVGQSTYRWKKMCMAPEAQAQFIESRESDVRFLKVEDNTRGIRFFAYQHGNDTIETYTSEYCPLKRIYVIPESTSGKGKVLEYHGTDFEPVRMGGMGEFHLRPSASGGHERIVTSYMEAVGTLICKHPAAIARLENFTV